MKLGFPILQVSLSMAILLMNLFSPPEKMNSQFYSLYLILILFFKPQALVFSGRKSLILGNHLYTCLCGLLNSNRIGLLLEKFSSPLVFFSLFKVS